MKKIIALTLILTFAASTVAFAHPFNDVAGHWAEAEIEKGYTNKVINGDGDGSFRPDDSITRGEFLKMVVATACEKMNMVSEEKVTVSDDMGDGSHWASKYYSFATAILYAPLNEAVDGIYPGAMNSAEEYDMAISRWEMAYILSEATYNLTGETIEEKDLTFADSEEIANYPEAIGVSILYTNELGFMKGDENNNFAPKAKGTRAEAVTVINRIDDHLQEIVDAMNADRDAYYEEIKNNQVVYTDAEIPKGHPQATIIMEDNKRIVIELYPEYAPQTVANFVKLAKEGAYDGTTFHRIIDGFMAQGGGRAEGEIKYITGEFAANGFEENTLKHERGTISMARSVDNNSASSEFFICYDEVPILDGEYAAFGKVKSGMEVVSSFAKAEMTYNESGELASPVKPIKIKKITIK